MKSQNSLLLLLGVLSTTVLTAPTLTPGTTSEEGAAPVDENIRCFPTLTDLPHDLIDNVNLRLDPLSSKTLQLLTNKSFRHLRRLDQEEELFDKMKLLVNDKRFFWAIINGDDDVVLDLALYIYGPSLLLGLQLAVQYGKAEAARVVLACGALRWEECNDKRKELELAAKNLLTESQLNDLAAWGNALLSG